MLMKFVIVIILAALLMQFSFAAQDAPSSLRKGSRKLKKKSTSASRSSLHASRPLPPHYKPRAQEEDQTKIQPTLRGSLGINNHFVTALSEELVEILVEMQDTLATKSQREH